MNALPFTSVKAIIDAWKQAEIAAIVAEDRWMAALRDIADNPTKEENLKMELIRARENARMLYEQVLNATGINEKNAVANLHGSFKKLLG